MGYRSVQYIPRITSYKAALAHFKQTKPIRGHSPERFPLGRRRDHDAFWMRMRADNAVEFIAYKTPVVTFLPDDAEGSGIIEVRTAGYATTTTHMFITQVLGIQASRYAPHWTQVRAGQDVALLGGAYDLPTAVARLRNVDGALVFAGDVAEHYQYAMDRKAANNVRRKYKEFTDYFAGMLKLRTQRVSVGLRAVPANSPLQINHEYDQIMVNYSEIEQALGYDEEGKRLFTLHAIGQPLRSGTRVQGYAGDDYEVRAKQEALMLQMIDPDQPEQTKTENYYKVALALMVGGRAIKQNPLLQDFPVSPTATTLGLFKSGLLMAHAKQVLTLTKLPRGKLPSRTYNGWIYEGETQ
jgi:hypothetical protein